MIVVWSDIIQSDFLPACMESTTSCSPPSDVCFIYHPYCSLSNEFSLALFSTVYGFKAGTGGLVYLGLGIGFFSATIFGAKFADKVYKNVRLQDFIPGTSLNHLSPRSLDPKMAASALPKCAFQLFSSDRSLYPLAFCEFLVILFKPTNKY